MTEESNGRPEEGIFPCYINGIYVKHPYIQDANESDAEAYKRIYDYGQEKAAAFVQTAGIIHPRHLYNAGPFATNPKIQPHEESAVQSDRRTAEDLQLDEDATESYIRSKLLERRRIH